MGRSLERDLEVGVAVLVAGFMVVGSLITVGVERVLRRRKGARR